jgi:hypothetical protein
MINVVQKKWLIRGSLFILICLAIFAALSGTIMSQIDEPKYTLVRTDGNIEIRDYEPMIVAEVEVGGDRLTAINKGFLMLADYIFGNNIPAQKLSMTAPGSQQAGQKVSMQVPITEQDTGFLWKVRFVMPPNQTRETLPEPSNNDVRLISIPSKRFVVLRFSGFNRDSNIRIHQKMLFDYTEKENLASTSEPIVAHYNPPWTLPFLKRHEIMLELPKIDL